jgi:MFS family permease
MPVFSSDILSTPTSKLRALFKPKGTVYYGWWIVTLAAFVQFLCSLLWMQSYGAYTVVLHQEFGWSMTLLSGAYALTRVESGLLGPLQGWLVDRYGPRLILSIGLLMFGLGLLWLTQVESLLVYYIVVFLISIGISLGGYHTLMVSIVNWFQRHRTKAVSYAQLGNCLGGLSLPMLAWGLEHQGWRMMAFISGVIVLVIGIPIVQGIRHRPEDIGEVMDGGLTDDFSLSNKKRSTQTPSPSWKQSVRTSAFWHISVGHSIALLSVSTVLVHLIPHLTRKLGMGLTTAGLVFSTISIFQILGVVCGGYLGDRFNKRLICVCCMIFHGIGMLILAFFDEYSLLILFAMLHGLAWGIRAPQMVAIRADYFGPESFGRIMGISSLIVMLGMMGGPIFCGIVVDHYGIYQNAFMSIGIVSMIGAIFFYMARKPDFLTT